MLDCSGEPSCEIAFLFDRHTHIHTHPHTHTHTLVEREFAVSSDPVEEDSWLLTLEGRSEGVEVTFQVTCGNVLSFG